MKKIMVLFALFCVTTLFLVLISATHQFDKSKREVHMQVMKVKSVTQRYHNPNNAIKKGYISTEECVEAPGLGAMGIHYLNPELIDGKVELKKPEGLLYIPTKRGLKLVGVEYFVPKAAINTTPILFGRNSDGPMPGHFPGQPEHYDLHVWIWEENPSGMFAPFNPNLHCSDL